MLLAVVVSLPILFPLKLLDPAQRRKQTQQGSQHCTGPAHCWCHCISWCAPPQQCLMALQNAYRPAPLVGVSVHMEVRIFTWLECPQDCPRTFSEGHSPSQHYTQRLTLLVSIHILVCASSMLVR